MSGPRFTPEELAAATGGEWKGPKPPTLLTGIRTDSRENGEGALFLALAGERFDGHDFLREAQKSGFAALCVNRNRLTEAPAEIPVLAVPDTLLAYQAIGRFHRRRYPGLKLAMVTGSVGKTSVKEMLRAIFEAAAGPEGVLYTLGNTNNQVGVPQNLLRLNADHRYAVIEAGTNHHGEIEPLSRTAEPSAALVNSIAPCHLEFLGDLAGVAREKAHIFDGLLPGGTAVVPMAGPEAATLGKLANERTPKLMRFGEKGEVSSEYLGGTLTGSRFRLKFRTGETFELEWGLTGRHQALNAAAAATAAWALGVTPAVIARGLVNTALPGMRMKVTEVNGVTYVNDAYNANPASMRACLEWLGEFADAGKLVLLLGEMRELGPGGAEEHRMILDFATGIFPGARILTVGGLWGECDGVENFAVSREAGTRLREVLQEGMLVLAKGSRGVALEEALPC